jgi:hypothetical protein
MRADFRLTRIDLDREEDVASVVAVTTPMVLTTIGEVLGTAPEVLSRTRGDTEVEIRLRGQEVLDVFNGFGKFPGSDPRHCQAVYDSLGCVVYGLMEDD